MWSSKRSVEINTGELEPLVFKEMNSRINSIKFKSRPAQRYGSQLHTLNTTQMRRQLPVEVETDHVATNFHPQKSDNATFTRNTIVSSQKRKPLTFHRKSAMNSSVDADRKRPLTAIKGKSTSSRLNAVKNALEVKGQQHAVIFKQQTEHFRQIYELLASILQLIKEDNLLVMEEAISQYLNFIQSKKLSFIDDFMESKERKLQKVVREARLSESLSIAYLFLEKAQQKIENNESYLTNFIGYCLSNVLLCARVYILKEGKSDLQQTWFEKLLRGFEQSSYGHMLSKVEDVLFRLQHNNEIIRIMHRKLGKFNPKFETCIQLFFKNAERKKTPCMQCTYYIFEYLAMHIHESDLIGISNTLQIAPTPYCPPPFKNYTLVIEPLGILIENSCLRPYTIKFLEWASKHFDIVMWTWEMPYEEQVQLIYEKLERFITSKLYRYHCIMENDIYLKDLSRLGRALDNVILLDYDKRIYSRHSRNGIEMRWRSFHSKDKGLLYLCQILQEMVSSESDVKDTLQIYAQQVFNLKGY